MTTQQAEQAHAERVAAYVKERQAERQRTEARERALASPDGVKILELEARWERLHRDQSEMMTLAFNEGRTLCTETERPLFDQMSAERDDLAHQVARLQAKYMPPLP